MQKPDWDDVHRRAKESLDAYDAMPPKVRKRIQQFPRYINTNKLAFQVMSNTTEALMNAIDDLM